MKVEISATKEMIGFILNIGNALGSSLEDGKITVGDLPSFISPLLNAGSAFAHASEIPLEMFDLDDEERDELLAYAKDTFSIPQEEVEELVDCAFDIMVQLHILVEKSRAVFCKKPE